MLRMQSVKNSRGMTLLELLTVVVIAGIMAAMAVPTWLEAMPRLRTKAVVRDVVSKMREARSLAVSRKEPHGVVLDQATNQYTVFIDREAPEDGAFTAGDSVVTQTALGYDVALYWVTFPNEAVIFNPDGSCNNSGLVFLGSDDYSCTYTIDLLASTGRVRMAEGFGFAN